MIYLKHGNQFTVRELAFKPAFPQSYASGLTSAFSLYGVRNNLRALTMDNPTGEKQLSLRRLMADALMLQLDIAVCELLMKQNIPAVDEYLYVTRKVTPEILSYAKTVAALVPVPRYLADVFSKTTKIYKVKQELVIPFEFSNKTLLERLTEFRKHVTQFAELTPYLQYTSGTVSVSIGNVADYAVLVANAGTKADPTYADVDHLPLLETGWPFVWMDGKVEKKEADAARVFLTEFTFVSDYLLTRHLEQTLKMYSNGTKTANSGSPKKPGRRPRKASSKK